MAYGAKRAWAISRQSALLGMSDSACLWRTRREARRAARRFVWNLGPATVFSLLGDSVHSIRGPPMGPLRAGRRGTGGPSFCAGLAVPTAFPARRWAVVRGFCAVMEAGGEASRTGARREGGTNTTLANSMRRAQARRWTGASLAIWWSTESWARPGSEPGKKVEVARRRAKRAVQEKVEAGLKAKPRPCDVLRNHERDWSRRTEWRGYRLSSRQSR